MKKKKLTKLKKSKLMPNRVKTEARREKQKRSLKRVESKLLAPNKNYSKELKPTKVKSNKLNYNPLFINFLNWKGDKHSVELLLERLSNNLKNQKDKDQAILKSSRLSEEYLLNLDNFHKVFKKYILETILSKTVSDEFLTWLTNSYKYIKAELSEEGLNQSIELEIVDHEGPWFESIICHNFVMTFNYFTAEIIKRCPVCSSFFCHKGKYAKYCSEGCKSTGVLK